MKEIRKAKEKIILCDNTMITLNCNITTCGAPVHSLEYDGASTTVIGSVFTEREIEIFKEAVLGERARIWDESMDLVDDDVMRKLLKHKKFKCSHCNLEFYVDKIKTDVKDEEQISKYICDKCLKIGNKL